MSSAIWLFTHDIQVDRRIFFFADVFQSLGYEVKLFAAPCFESGCAYDEEYVTRPAETEVVREYHLREIPAELSGRMSLMKARQEEFYQKNRYYSRSLKELGVPGETQERTKAVVNVKGDDYAIQLETEDAVYLYSSLSQKTACIKKKFDTEECRKCEEAIMYALCRKETDRSFVYRGVLVERTTKNGRVFYYANIPRSNLLFIYEEEREVLFQRSPVHHEKYGKDVLGNRPYHFENFKEKIYDYTKIFTAMKGELEKEIPFFVYVADLPTLPIGYMLKEAYGVPLMIDCHEWWYKQTVLWEPSDIHRQELALQYERKLYPACDLRVTVGYALASRMSEFFGLAFEVIYSCMSRKLDVRFCKDPDIWNRRFGIPKHSKVAVFQGGMTPNRNLENLAAATRYLEKDSYLVLFSREDSYQKKIKKVLQKSGNPERVVWAGWVKEEELLAYIVNADIGIIPYIPLNDYAECFVPNKLPEYYKAGLPVLYCRGMLELERVIDHDGTGMAADLGSAAEFGAALNQLLHDEEWKEKMQVHYTDCGERFGYQKQRSVLKALLRKNFAIEELAGRTGK